MSLRYEAESLFGLHEHNDNTQIVTSNKISTVLRRYMKYSISVLQSL